MKKQKKKSWFNSFTEPFEYFYLGILASVGLSLGSVMVIGVLRYILESFLGFEILIYSRITFSIFYLFFLVYTYRYLDMQKNKTLRNGFLLWAIIFILCQIYVWLSSQTFV